MSDKKLTDRQYQVLLDLFNELYECFSCIPLEYKRAFYDRLYSKE